jgi:hypothetical protein
MNLGHWVLKEGINIAEDVFGFIYEIKNNVNNKTYIGKKQCCRKVKKKPLKGKKRNRIEIKESDWKTYTGSSTDLNEDIVKYGKENFTFTILKICNSKWELGYEEIKEQISKDVIMREDYYNGILNVRIGRPPKSLFNSKSML